MGKLAFVFAGQGAQKPGMCQDLYAQSAVVRELIDLAEAERPGVRELMFSGPEDLLNITVNTQPCLFLADLACALALSERGIKPEGLAGFSLGEIPAACFSGLMDEAQAFKFVCHRAEAMQACAEKSAGAMFALVKLSAAQIEALCASLDQVYPVNFNSAEQTVVACAESSAEALQSAVAAAGGKALKLKVSGAFHSPFMEEASASVARYLESVELDTPQIPLYANATAQPYGEAKELLATQIKSPVLWHKTIENMAADGFTTFVEVGPGKALTALIKRIDGSLVVHNVSDSESLERTLEELNNV
jgi:[acyl-carrier-protein] S-malonyltransferase